MFSAKNAQISPKFILFLPPKLRKNFRESLVDPNSGGLWEFGTALSARRAISRTSGGIGAPVGEQRERRIDAGKVEGEGAILASPTPVGLEYNLAACLSV